ncbi:putative Ig domain-containing protein, partial [Vibrio pacinii]|uniref:putative Ig domain-containing protein n=1 Tax=Vibrio pacinii TaxID=170674 RepID=UPI00056F66D7
MSVQKSEDASNKQTRPSEEKNAKKRDDKAKTRAKELDEKAKLLKAKEFRNTNVESDFNRDLVADKSWHSAHAQVIPEETPSQGELDESTTDIPESTSASRSEDVDVNDINSFVDTNDSQVEPTANKDLGTHRGGHHIAVDVKETVLGGNNFKSTLVAHSDNNQAELVINLHHSPASNHSANQLPQANTVAQHTLVINHLPPVQSLKEDASVNTVDGRLTASGDGSQSVSWSVASTHGKYGDLQLDSKTGEWHYHLDNRLVETDQLGEGEVHTEHFTVTATDKFGHVIQTQVKVNVEGTNDAPTVTHAVADQAVDQDGTLQFALPADTFSDIDHGDTLMLSTGTLPAWLHFDASTGTFSGTPANSDVGQTSITVTATDTAGAQVSTTFDLTVNNVNDAPVLIPMATVKVDEDGATASGHVYATDIDAGDTLTFSAGQVDGLTFQPDGSWTFD